MKSLAAIFIDFPTSNCNIFGSIQYIRFTPSLQHHSNLMLQPHPKHLASSRRFCFGLIPSSNLFFNHCNLCRLLRISLRIVFFYKWLIAKTKQVLRIPMNHLVTLPHFLADSHPGGNHGSSPSSTNS